MKSMAPDEKAVLVMLYTQNMLVRGEVIVKENVRVSIWLRTQGVPNYVHIIKPNVVMFGGSPPKVMNYSEIFVPTPQIIAFHIVPPAKEILDYDESETNRMMVPVNAVVGTFLMKAHVRISTQADLATSLDVMRAAWVSLYDADIHNPYLPQMNVRVPMLLISPAVVSFGLD